MYTFTLLLLISSPHLISFLESTSCPDLGWRLRFTVLIRGVYHTALTETDLLCPVSLKASLSSSLSRSLVYLCRLAW